MALLDSVNAPKVIVEFDFGWKGYFTIAISPLGGTDVLGGNAGINWQALDSGVIRSVSIRRGRSREDQANQPGQLTLVVDNLSGDFDPDNPSSTYQWQGYSTLMRGMGVRVWAAYGASIAYNATGVAYNATGVPYSGNTSYELLYTGYLEAVKTDSSLDPIVTFTATDALALLGTQNLAQIASSYSGDTTSARIGRVLDAIGWLSTARSLTGSRQMQPTTYNATPLSLAEQAAACEFGRFHADRKGNLVLIPYENLKTTPTRFALSDTRAANTVEYDTIVTDPGARFLVNQVVLTQYTNYSQTSSNTASINRFGTYQKTVTAPLLDDGVATTMAGYYASRTAFPLTRVDRIEFDGLGLTTQWNSIIVSELGDQVTVARTTVDGRSLAYTNLIESISHDITPSSWRVGLDLSPTTF
jgi:hypothetical protein